MALLQRPDSFPILPDGVKHTEALRRRQADLDPQRRMRAAS
jgi:hypothetical protein